MSEGSSAGLHTIPEVKAEGTELDAVPGVLKPGTLAFAFLIFLVLNIFSYNLARSLIREAPVQTGRGTSAQIDSLIKNVSSLSNSLAAWMQQDSVERHERMLYRRRMDSLSALAPSCSRQRNCRSH